MFERKLIRLIFTVIIIYTHNSLNSLGRVKPIAGRLRKQRSFSERLSRGAKRKKKRETKREEQEQEGGPGDKIFCSVVLRVCRLLTVIAITWCVNRVEEQHQPTDDSLVRGQAACTNA